MSVCLKVTARTTFIPVQEKGSTGNVTQSRAGQDRGGAGLDAVPAPSQ